MNKKFEKATETYFIFRDLVDWCNDNEGVDEIFDFKTSLKKASKEMKENPAIIADIIDEMVERLNERMVAMGVCPVCGGRLDLESNGCDTWVVYGSTHACYEEGSHLVCQDCGETYEQ